MIKTVLLFILIILITVIFLTLMSFILPIKASVISSDIGEYKAGDVLFYTAAENYNVNDFILYAPTSWTTTIIAEIVEKNPDNTFVVKGIKQDLTNISDCQIIGKIINKTSPYIFYPIVLVIIAFISFIITRFISKKMDKKIK